MESPTSESPPATTATPAPTVLPFGYYDDLRASPTATFVPLVPPEIVFKGGSFEGGRNLYRAIDPDSGLPAPGVILCHIPAFLRWTQLDQTGNRLIDASDGGYDGAVGVLMAMHHFNNGIGTIVDELEGINQKCSIRLTTENVDSMGWELVSTSILWNNTINNGFDDATNPLMGALIGTTTSTVTSAIASQTALFDLPQFSPSATSTLLDNPYEFPLFSRTIASDDATAARLTGYMQTELNVTYFGMIYVNDAYGGSFQSSVRQWATLRRMQLYSFPVQPGASESEILEALRYLQEQQVNYIVGVFYPYQYEDIMTMAYELEMAGAGKLWFLSAALDPIFSGPDRIELKTDSPVTRASHGNAVLHDESGLPGFPQYDRFLEEWRGLATDEEALQYFNSKVPQWEYQAYFTNETAFAFNRTKEYFSRNPTIVSGYAYDAVVALGLGACIAQANIVVGNSTVSPMDMNSTFTGSHHFSSAIGTEFNGASGQVRFGADGSHSRDGNSTLFVVSNVRETRHSNGTSTLSSVPTTYHNIETSQWESYRNETFIFPGDASIPPPDLPPPDTTLLHFAPAARITCLILSALAMIAAIVFLAFSISMRKHRIIRASQPEFLSLVCVGCFLMASAIIPLSIDSSIASEYGCAIACISKFWLLSIGFCLTFVALFR